MAWVFLLGAGVGEIIMAAALKAADGWRKPIPSGIGLLATLVSVGLLTQALKDLPTGTAYAIWTGIGAIGIAVLGIVAYGDSASPMRLLCMALIVTGILGLRLMET